MRKASIHFGFWILLVLRSVASPVVGQDPDKPLALVRQIAGTENYFVKVVTNVKLEANHKVSAILTNKNSLNAWTEDVKDCPAKSGQFCSEFEDGLLVLKFELAGRPQPGDKIKVNFAISDDTGRGTFRSIDLIQDFKAGGPRLDSVCENGLIVDLQADNPTLDANAAEADYYRSRLFALNKWLRSNKSDPSMIAIIHIEPLAQPTAPDPTVVNFSISPAVDPVNNPQELDIESALASQKVLLCLQLNKKLPNEKFNAQILLKNSPPLELDKALTKALAGPKAVAAPLASKISEENKLGLRAFDNNLELGMLFNSSVKDVKVNNILTRQRQNRGSLDLRFAPLLRNRTKPPEAKKWQLLRTPFFVDAKISTGKISEDTLSLNRVLFGTELNFRYVNGTKKGERDKYVISLRGTNASDRDFKVAEAKGEFEFRPIFENLNQPLKTKHSSSKSILIPDGPQIELSEGGWFGYQIQPFIGFEGGRVYRRSRSAFKLEEQNDNIYRLLFGADVAFNLTSRFTLALTDVFYFRGESPSHRQRNYFNGSIEAPLGNLDHNAAHSVFLSFERGNQPPFASPAVNAFKFGYRIRSDFFSTGSSR